MQIKVHSVQIRLLLKAAWVCLFCFLAPFSEAQLKKSFRRPSPGNSDKQGFARVERGFYALDLGGGHTCDFFFKFSTNPELETSYMGLYWTIPFFDSHVIKKSNTRYEWISPAFGKYTFNKEKSDKLKGIETYRRNNAGDWVLKVTKKGRISIFKESDKDFRYDFENGRLVSFCAGSGADTFKIRYTGKGHPIGMYNASKGSSVLELSYKNNLLTQLTFVADKKTITIAYAPCNALTEDGRTKQSDKSLSSPISITYSDAQEEKYIYENFSLKNRKILDSKGAESNAIQCPVNRISFNQKENYLEWDASTGMIISDSGGEYALYSPLLDKYNPDTNSELIERDRAKGHSTNECIVSYKRADKKFADIWNYSSRTAVEVKQNPDTGELTRTSYIGMPGKTLMKVRKQEKISHNKRSEWQLLTSKVYNEKGDLIREFDGLGNMKEFIYDEKGIHWKTFKNGILMFFAYNDDKNNNLKFMAKNPDGSITKVINKGNGIFEMQQNFNELLKYKIIYNKNKCYLDIKGFKFYIPN